MTHTYNVSGMTCGGCQAKVQSLLSGVKGVNNVMIDLTKGQVAIDMNKHISIPELAEALKDYPKYQIRESNDNYHDTTADSGFDETRSWIETYKPVLLIFGYIVGVTILIELISGTIIKASSITVTVVMGKLNTSPRQAHLIFLFFNTLCKTPTILKLITIKVATFVIIGLNPVRKAIPKASSVKAYI